MPLVSVIIPCYNHAHYLSTALESVVAQTYASWEAVIVNDGSRYAEDTNIGSFIAVVEVSGGN